MAMKWNKVLDTMGLWHKVNEMPDFALSQKQLDIDENDEDDEEGEEGDSELEEKTRRMWLVVKEGYRVRQS